VENLSKRNKTDIKTQKTNYSGRINKFIIMDNVDIENVVNQIIIENLTLFPSVNRETHNRIVYRIPKNGYSSRNCQPFLIHIQSIDR